MPELVVADLLSGLIRAAIPFTKLSWTKPRNAAETIRVTVPMRSRAVRRLDLRNATTPAKNLLAVIENDIVVAAGLIWSRRWSDSTKELTLGAAGIWSYFDHRQVMPVLTDDQEVIDPSTGDSASWAATELVDLSYGTMAKRLVQQSMLWTGGNLPIVFGADEAGPWSEHYKGATVPTVGKELASFVRRQRGVDIEFRGQRTADRRGIQFELRTGTLAEPEMHGPTVHRWDLSVPKPSVRNLQTADDASTMTGQAWVIGGRADGTAVVKRSINHQLTDLGYPLLELVDSTHNDASVESTLLQYSDQWIVQGAAPSNSWSFEALATSNPRVGSFWPGDFSDFIIRPDHEYLEPGPHRREIASISGDQDGRWVKVITEETIDA